MSRTVYLLPWIFHMQVAHTSHNTDTPVWLNDHNDNTHCTGCMCDLQALQQGMSGCAWALHANSRDMTSAYAGISQVQHKH